MVDGTDLTDAGYEWARHALEREHTLLGGHPADEELAEFLDGLLFEARDGKASPDYRLYRDEEPGLTAELVEKAIRKIAW